VGLFSRNKTVDAPETVPVIACADSKKIRLNKTLSKETISAMAAATLQTSGWVEAPAAEPNIGDNMPDGTVFAGVSPDTNKPMYATPADAPLIYTFNDAQGYAAKLDAHGHKDWHVPTKAELNVLFNNRAAIGGFNVTGSVPAGWYWSASPNLKWHAWGQRFSGGYQLNDYKVNHSAVRCVR